MRKIACIGLFLALLIPDLATGQSFFAMRRSRNLIFSFGTGTSTYFGELKNPGLSIDTRLNVNLGLQVFVTHRVSARAEITWFQLEGYDSKADDDRVTRNLSFTSNNYEINVSGLFNLTPNGRRYYQRPNLNTYFFAGIALLYMNPQTEYQGNTVSLQPLQTEGVSYSTFQPVIPFGLGIRMKSGPFFNICIEGGYRLTFTDYMDDVSTTRYPDPTTLSSDLSRALSDRRGEYYAGVGESFTPVPNVGRRGNPKANDGYFLLNIKLEYYLPYDFLSGGNHQQKLFKSKRKAFYRYNKRGGLRR